MVEPLVVFRTVRIAGQGRRSARELRASGLVAGVTCFPGLTSVDRWIGTSAGHAHRGE